MIFCKLTSVPTTSRIGEWSSDEEDNDTGAPVRGRQDPHAGKTVVIAKAFTLDELDASDDREAETREIAEDIEDQAKLYGKIVEVLVMDRERRGIVTVRFENEGAAQKCVEGLSGRVFDGRRLAAWVQDGMEVWARTTVDEPKRKKPKRAVDDPEEEERRLKEYSEYLDSTEAKGEEVGDI